MFCFFYKESKSEKKNVFCGGGRGRGAGKRRREGARVSDFFLLKIQIHIKKKMFFGGVGVEMG